MCEAHFIAEGYFISTATSCADRRASLKKALCLRKVLFSGAPGGTRTPDLLVRSQTLYPAELLAHLLLPNYNSICTFKNQALFSRHAVILFFQFDLDANCEQDLYSFVDFPSIDDEDFSFVPSMPFKDAVRRSSTGCLFVHTDWNSASGTAEEITKELLKELGSYGILVYNS